MDFAAVKYQKKDGKKIADIDAAGWFVYDNDDPDFGHPEGFHLFVDLGGRKAVGITFTRTELKAMLDLVESRTL